MEIVFIVLKQKRQNGVNSLLSVSILVNLEKFIAKHFAHLLGSFIVDLEHVLVWSKQLMHM